MQFPSLISLIEHQKGLSTLAPDDTASQKTVLYIVEPASQERFIKQLSPRDQNWLEANQYRFKAGSTIVLCDADGHLSSAILAVGNTPQWDAAQAVSTLPQAHYIPVLDYAPDTPLSEIQLGWQLAHYHFAQMPRGAYFINGGRGRQVVEADLLEAVRSGHLSGAALDVFETEPLPSEHPFWDEDRITIWPHVAAQTNPNTAARQVAQAISDCLNGIAPKNQVQRTRGY